MALRRFLLDNPCPRLRLILRSRFNPNAPYWMLNPKSLRALVDYVSKFKSREFEVSESTLTAFFGRPKGHETGLGKDKDSDAGHLNSIARLIGAVQPDGKTQRGGTSYNKDGFIELALEESVAYRDKWGKRFD